MSEAVQNPLQACGECATIQGRRRHGTQSNDRRVGPRSTYFVCCDAPYGSEVCLEEGIHRRN